MRRASVGEQDVAVRRAGDRPADAVVEQAPDEAQLAPADDEVGASLTDGGGDRIGRVTGTEHVVCGSSGALDGRRERERAFRDAPGRNSV